MNRRIISKLDAARWLNVSAPTLSNYIRAGQIKAHSLVGEGRHARIDIIRAVTDLQQSLNEERLLLPHRRVRLSTKPPVDWDYSSK